MTTDECQYCQPGVPATVVITFEEDGRTEDVGACTEHAQMCPDNAGVRPVREETDPCERGTVGCSVAHMVGPDAPCETW